MSDFTLKLRRPVMVNGHQIDEVTLRPPSLDGFVRLLAIGDIGDEIQEARETVAALADLPGEVVGKLDLRDFVELSEAAAPLLEEALAAAPAITRH